MFIDLQQERGAENSLKIMVQQQRVIEEEEKKKIEN